MKLTPFFFPFVALALVVPPREALARREPQPLAQPTQAPEPEIGSQTTFNHGDATTVAPTITTLFDKRSPKVKLSFTIKPAVQSGAIESDAAYVDIYGCAGSNINVTDLKHLDSVQYGCRYYALATYFINQGEKAVFNLSYLVNEKLTFKKNYEEYTKKIWESLYLDFGTWLYGDGGNKYYTCALDRNDKSKCIKGKKFHDLYIADEQINEAAKSIGDFYNISSFTKKDFGQISDKKTTKTSAGDKLSISNVTLIAVTLLIPNPLDGLTVQNISDLANLVATARASLKEVSPIDLVDFLTPVPIYSSVATHAMNIDETGRKELEQERKERLMKILGIIFMVLGALTMFMGFPEAMLAQVGLAAVQSLSTYAVTGKFDASELVTGIMGSVNAIFALTMMGAKIGEAAQAGRMAKQANTAKGMLNMADYKSSMSRMFGIIFH